MKLNLNTALLLCIGFAASLTISSCTNDDDKKCCEGYTGKISDARADSLVNRCHFLSKDSIELWVKRYETFKERLNKKPDYRTDNKDTANANDAEMKANMDEVAKRFLMGGSVSYNNCIIKKILCDKNSIGLRVLYGIGADNRIHIMLVGIQPDYSNLYVSGEDCCDKTLNKSLGAGLTGANGAPGGAEYGQMP